MSRLIGRGDSDENGLSYAEVTASYVTHDQTKPESLARSTAWARPTAPNADAVGLYVIRYSCCRETNESGLLFREVTAPYVIGD